MLFLAAAAEEAGATTADLLQAFLVSNGASARPSAARPAALTCRLVCAAAGHVVVEALLLATIVFLLLQRSYKPDKKPLTERVRARPRRRRPAWLVGLAD